MMPSSTSYLRSLILQPIPRPEPRTTMTNPAPGTNRPFNRSQDPVYHSLKYFKQAVNLPSNSEADSVIPRFIPNNPELLFPGWKPRVRLPGPRNFLLRRDRAEDEVIGGATSVPKDHEDEMIDKDYEDFKRSWDMGQQDWEMNHQDEMIDEVFEDFKSLWLLEMSQQDETIDEGSQDPKHFEPPPSHQADSEIPPTTKSDLAETLPEPAETEPAIPDETLSEGIDNQQSLDNISANAEKKEDPPNSGPGRVDHTVSIRLSYEESRLAHTQQAETLKARGWRMDRDGKWRKA